MMVSMELPRSFVCYSFDLDRPEDPVSRRGGNGAPAPAHGIGPSLREDLFDGLTDREAEFGPCGSRAHP